MFFEYASNGFSREEIEDNLSQMPDDVRLPADGIKIIVKIGISKS